MHVNVGVCTCLESGVETLACLSVCFCAFEICSVRQTEFLLRPSQSVVYFKELLFSAIFVFVLVELFKPMTCLVITKELTSVRNFRSFHAMPYVSHIFISKCDRRLEHFIDLPHWPFISPWPVEAAFKNLCSSISRGWSPGETAKGLDFVFKYIS